MRVGDGAPTPLGDLRVVEVSDRIAGGYCGKLLVDAGADVVKVEPVTGDPLRRFTATGAVPPSRADSPMFSYLNAGKRSVTTVSEELLARADVVIVAATRTAAIERGIDPRQLLENAPHPSSSPSPTSDGPVHGRSARRRSSPCRRGQG